MSQESRPQSAQATEQNPQEPQASDPSISVVSLEKTVQIIVWGGYEELKTEDPTEYSDETTGLGFGRVAHYTRQRSRRDAYRPR